MNCQDNSRLKVPLPEACRTADIGCVPISNGKPKCPPEPDQLPLAYDPNSKTIWIFDCDSRDWNAYTRFSLSELGEVSLDNFRDVCNMLKVPVFYNPGTGTVEGHMTLADFGDKLKECLNLPGTDSKTVVKAGDNVNVTSSTAGSTTTYVVSATGGGDEDSKTVIEAGDNITLTSSKSGATTTYKISSTGAGPGDSKTVLTEGTNIKLTKSESGATTTYKIDCTAEGADGNDVTVVEAGSNVNVTSSKSGNTTTYTVSATGGGPSDSKTILQGKDGGNVIVTSTTSGATTTYTLDSKDSKSVVKAGTGISVAASTSGDTTTYTVTNTAPGEGGTPVSITGGTGIEVNKTTSSGVDNYTIKSTVPTVTVTAGDNVTVNKTTSTDGSTVDYKVSSTGGGPQDSKTIVAAGTGINVTSSTSGATTTYTVTNTGGGGGGTPVNITGGTGINVDKTTSGGVDNYTITCTVPTVKVAAGTGISVTSATSSGVTTYTVTNTGGGGGGNPVIFGGSGDSTGKGNVPHHHSIISNAIPISPGHQGSDEDYTFFSRDAMFRNGETAHAVQGNNNNPWYLEIECTNPYSSASTLVIDLDASCLFRARGEITDGTAIGGGGSLVDHDVCFVFSLTDDLNINLADFIVYNNLFLSHPSFSNSTHPMFKGTNWGIVHSKYDSNRILNAHSTISVSSLGYMLWEDKVQVARYVGQIPANQTKTVYLQYFLFGRTGGILRGTGSAEDGDTLDQYLTASVRHGQWIVSTHYNTAIYPG